MEVIEAEFVDGVLRPTRRLALRPGERVGIVVVRRPEPSRWDLVRLSRVISDEDVLTEAGLAEWDSRIGSFCASSALALVNDLAPRH